MNWDMWLGPAPFTEYVPERAHFTYRYFLDYSGGVFADFWCHIADVVWWAVQPKGLKSVVARGEKTDGQADAPKWLDADLEFDGPDMALRSAGLWKGRKLSRMSYLQLEGVTGLYLFLRGQFAPGDIARQLDSTEKEVWDILNQNPVLPAIQGLDKGNQASWMETNQYMQNQLLRDADVMSMAHGIEIRVPFLDESFQRYANRISAKAKYHSEVPKGWLIGEFNKELPEAIWNRPKMGFSFPFKEWFGGSEFVKEKMKMGGKKGQKNLEQLVFYFLFRNVDRLQCKLFILNIFNYIV